MIKKSLLATGIAATLAMGAALPASAQISVRIGPPPPRVEVVPPPRVGYTWAPGYWNYEGRRHVWHGGTWVRARPGYVYNAPTWVERNGRWELRRGAWARGDRDHDGVPNAVDRRPNDPTRR